MAVDQQMHMNMNINHTNVNDTINQFYGGNGGGMFPANNPSSFQPLCGLNDVVFQHFNGKVAQAVKDDSGVTFNNNVPPPPPRVSSRKRVREQIIPCGGPQLLTVNHFTKGTTASRSVGGVDFGCKDGASFGFLGEDLSLQLMQQQLELDRFISNHIEKMKMEIEERKKKEMRRIMVMVEEALGRKLREKDEELLKVGKINWALEEKVESLCLENQIWRDLAQTNEATANALRTNLEQVLEKMKENADLTAEVADDAVSCCGSSGSGDVERVNDEGDQQQWLMNGQNGWIYRGKSGESSNKKSKSDCSRGKLCRKCGEGESSVLLLPCRHLCLCTKCGPAVNSCPICSTDKNASVHVNLS